MTTAQPLTMGNGSPSMPDQASRKLARTNYLDAVMKRDRSMDGLFYYAVRTTGVYCRPSCPSRRPRPENVVFYDTRQAAREAGFRACKRCKPDSDSTTDPNKNLAEKVARYIDSHPDEPVTLDALSRAVGMSPFHLQRTFKAVTGITPKAYADSRRLESLKSSLRQGHSVTRSLYDAGYGSSSRLYERATSQLGMTPSRYRKQGSGETIRYTIAASDIGRMLLASTQKGICSVQFGDSDRTLEGALRQEYPQAELIRADRALAPSVRSIRDCVRGRDTGPLPLDIRSTAFQRMVWEHLQSIPRGVTESYSEVARRIGHPKAARAVARACATNPVAVAIPCHRVVRESGELGGYRWGIQRKKKLLTLEQKA